MTIPADLRRRDRLEALNQQQGRIMEQEAAREHAESLLRGIDALSRQFAALGPVPIDVLDRYERILAAAHAANLLRLDDYQLEGET
jgi:hypothetical protein